MRFLFTLQPGLGHLNVMLPFARAARDAGHTIAFASARSFGPSVENTGFELLEAGIDWIESDKDVHFPGAGVPGSGVMMEGDVFAGATATAMVPDLVNHIRTWRADAVVRDPWEFASCIAAEKEGIPYATCNPTLFGPDLLEFLFGTRLAELRKAHGLAPLDDFAMLHRYLDLAFFPPEFTEESEVVSPVTHFFASLTARDTPRPEWIAALPLRPTVHVSFGTVISPTELYRDVITALAEENVNVVVATGPSTDLSVLGPLPANVRLERYVSHAHLLPSCDLFITHGGFGSAIVALESAVPVLVLPIWADQPRNARICENIGLGRQLQEHERSIEQIRAAARAVLADPSYRTRAEAARSALTRLAPASAATELLERLVHSKAPILRSAPPVV
ncbi:MAG: glycosyltransferase, family [Labilithrix sp.]|nr:glycosyltransferase, family [Labilithrix sp.]